MTSALHLAQFNVARLRAPLTDPSVSEFVAGLDLISALADSAPAASSGASPRVRTATPPPSARWTRT